MSLRGSSNDNSRSRSRSPISSGSGSPAQRSSVSQSRSRSRGRSSSRSLSRSRSHSPRSVASSDRTDESDRQEVSSFSSSSVVILEDDNDEGGNSSSTPSPCPVIHSKKIIIHLSDSEDSSPNLEEQKADSDSETDESSDYEDQSPNYCRTANPGVDPTHSWSGEQHFEASYNNAGFVPMNYHHQTHVSQLKDHKHDSCDSMSPPQSQSTEIIPSQPISESDSDSESCNGAWDRDNCGCKNCMRYRRKFISNYLARHPYASDEDAHRKISKIFKEQVAEKNICHKCRKPGFAREGVLLKCEACYNEFKEEDKKKEEEEKEKERDEANKVIFEKNQKRANYRAAHLDHLPFEKVDLMTYGIKVASEKMGWNKFPYGCKDINNGKMVKNLKDVDSVFWRNKKRDYLVENFSDELKIVKTSNDDEQEKPDLSSSDDDSYYSDSDTRNTKDCDGEWSCCKNRIDAFDFMAYRKF